jgi:hypothetical protein
MFRHEPFPSELKRPSQLPSAANVIQSPSSTILRAPAITPPTPLEEAFCRKEGIL